jgi:protein-S-isoprenylcysteine O-methyltransferase Ste14
MTTPTMSKKELIRKVVIRALSFIVVMPLIYILTSGRIDYWQAWVYMAILFIPMIGVFFYLIKNDPALLERRMHYTEKVKEQQWIVSISSLLITPALLLPGLDIRFGWSHVSTAVVLLADIMVLLGYAIFIVVLRENTFLSRIVEVAENQKVISTGPYALVRHPMYLGAILMFAFTPLALGSYWLCIPGVLVVPTFIARILNEEKVLTSNLPGYTEYMQKTKFRLLPGIW